MGTERIKRALELARAEREGRNASVAPLVPLGEQRESRAVVDPVTREFEAAPIELTGRFLRTREVEVSSESMRRGRLLAPGLQGPLAQSFRMLRTQVLQRLRARDWNSLAIVASASPVCCGHCRRIITTCRWSQVSRES